MIQGYREIVTHYENCLEQHGDSHRGVDWPNEADATTRYRVMLELIPPEEKGSLLDFGCGTARLYQYMQEQVAAQSAELTYTGLDISARFVSVCRDKYPQLEFLQLDVLEDPVALPEYDYIVMNGVFTEKRGLGFDEMEGYFQRLLCAVFAKARKGIAFNVMSKAVDWEREDLFHLSSDRLIHFLVKNLSRHFVIRNDYGLYEYTTYVYKQPNARGGK